MPDAEMCDVPPSPPRRRKQLLRDELRSRRVHLSAVNVDYVADCGPWAGGDAACGDVFDPEEEVFEPEEKVFEPEEEEVSDGIFETVDASERRKCPDEDGVTPGVQAVLLEDGVCAVRIARTDGSLQTVVIRPPGEDGW